MDKKKEGALHFDLGKPKVSLIPYSALREEAYGMEYGVLKYSRDDWRKGMKLTRVAESTIRHMFNWLETETYDLESGLHHLANARASLGILIELLKTKPELDDRHEGVRKAPYTLEQVMEFRERLNLKTSDEMKTFIDTRIKEYVAFHTKVDNSD